MSLFSTIRSADRVQLRRDRSVEDPTPPLVGPVEAGVSLPRHLLVSLAGITAEITTLQQRCAGTPHLHAPLAAILGRLDGLADDIYEHAVAPTAPHTRHVGLAVGPPSDGPFVVPVDITDAGSVARLTT